MIELHVFGPGCGQPDASPFCMKADILLQMSGLPFRRVVGDLRRAPKKKLPFIVDDGVTIADSSFIRFHLEQKRGITFDQGLSPAERGIAWAAEKMLEDHLYWLMVHERWADGANFKRGPLEFFAAIPMPLRPLVTAMVRREVRRTLHGQGTARHDAGERLVLAERAFTSLAAILADKPFLMGEQPCGADASLGAFMIAGLSPVFASPLREAAAAHANLVAYAERIGARYFGGRLRAA